MLDPAVYDAWLDLRTPAEDVKGLLSQRLNGECQFNRVGRDVNATAINKQPNDAETLADIRRYNRIGIMFDSIDIDASDVPGQDNQRK